MIYILIEKPIALIVAFGIVLASVGAMDLGLASPLVLASLPAWSLIIAGFGATLGSAWLIKKLSSTLTGILTAFSALVGTFALFPYGTAVAAYILAAGLVVCAVGTWLGETSDLRDH